MMPIWIDIVDMYVYQYIPSELRAIAQNKR